MRKNIVIKIILFEILVCCCLAALAFIQQENQKPIELSMDSWSSDYVQYDDGWHADASLLQGNSDIDLIRGPYISLEKGTYSAAVDYETNYDQACIVNAEGDNDYIEAGEYRLPKGSRHVSFRFALKKDVDNFEIIVKYDGTGNLRIRNIEIRPDAFGFYRFFFSVIVLFLIVDLCFYFRKQIQENRNEVFVLAGMVFLISLPLFMKGIAHGHDINVHFMRIEGIAAELRNGRMPVRISSLWLDGHGYPISVYYGDLLLYLPAVLRIIGFSVVNAYKIYVFLINLGTVVISYFCFKKMFKKNLIAYMASLAYVTASYRFVDVYVRAAVGEYSAMMFLPVIALALCQMYTESYDDWRQTGRNALLLAFGMTGLIGTHILSAQMAVLVLFFVCGMLWKKTIRKNTLLVYALAVAETLTLNLYFMIPFLDYYMNIDVNVNAAKEAAKIQSLGAYIGQYFAFFKNAFGYSVNQADGRIGLTPGMALMGALLFALVLWINQKGLNKKYLAEIKYLTICSIVMLFVASDLFPWNYLAMNDNPIGKFFAQVQFPWRYISIAMIFMTMLLGFIFKYFSESGERAVLERMYLLTAGICIVISVQFVSNYSDDSVTVNYYDAVELDTYAVGGAEYLRTNTDWEYYQTEILQENMKRVSLDVRKGCYMELYCETTDLEGMVEVPMFHYKGYQVTDEYGNQYQIMDGNNNVIKFSVPANFSGKIMIDFVEPWYWRAGEIISLLFAVFLCMSAVFNRTKIFSKKEAVKA